MIKSLFSFSSLLTNKLSNLSSLFLLLLLLGSDNVVNSSSSCTEGSSSNKPLILTQFITSGNISEAQSLAFVHQPEFSTVKSYSGYFNVNATTNSNLFFWFFPSTLNEEKSPIILWLQGGPGTSSLFGLFVENGPFIINEALELSIRNSSWTLNHSVLYIDSPVGTGFSFTDSEDAYAKTQEDVASDLYNALEQFFLLFPSYQLRDFYIAGESYAGKYVPSISLKIHQENQMDPQIHMNLKGLIIGAGFSDPISMIDSYGTYMHSMGLIDEDAKVYIDEQAEITKQLILDGNYNQAAKVQDQLIGGETLPYPTYFKNKTGYDFYYNVLIPQIPDDHSYYIKYVQQPHIRSSLHVGECTTFHNQSIIVPEKLSSDIFQSVKSSIETLLNYPNQYSILFYAGQFDIVVSHLAVANLIKNMNWVGKTEYESEERQIWYSTTIIDKNHKNKLNESKKNIGGYIKKSQNFNFVILREAGHNAPYDQPELCLELITNFINGSL